MSFHHLDRWAAVPSPLTRLAPTARLLGAIVVAVGAALLPLGAWPQIGALLAFAIAAALLARMPPLAILRRVAAPLGLVLLMSVGIMVLAPGDPVARLGPLAATDAGVLRFGSILGRAAAALGIMVVLVSTTRFTELLQALRELRLPAVVTDSLGLAYRYLYLLNDEVERLRRAARSRNAATSAAARRRFLTGITAAALARSYARSERCHQAMLARGFDGALPSLAPRPLDRRSLAVLAGTVAGVAGLVLSAWL